MNIGWNINCVLTISSFFIICGIFYLFLRLDWKRYGILLFRNIPSGRRVKPALGTDGFMLDASVCVPYNNSIGGEYE